MKIIKHKAVVPIVYSLAGLFYLFEPFLSAWFEIVNPFIARNFFLTIDWMIFVITLPLPSDLQFYFPDIFFGFLTLLYLVFFVVIAHSDWTDIQKRYTFAPLMVLPLIWALMSPLGLSYYGKRVNSYVVGGWSRMMLAGGPTTLRNDSVYLLENAIASEPDWQELPSSIKRLNGWVEVEFEKQLVLVGTGRMFNMANEFGFIIQKEKATFAIPNYLESSDSFRIWKLADGVYLFDR
jgi:hypothetical protein